MVDTMQAGNVGAAARALKNMGLSRLRLVNPPDLSEEECRFMAVSAYDIVTSAAVYSTFEQAVADQQILIGTTSSRGRRQRTPILSAREAAPMLLRYAEKQRVCLVFGPERSGLCEEHLALCQYLVTIPGSLELPTLNVAQAILILAYEIFTAEPAPEEVDTQIVSHQVREKMFEHMQETLVNIGFLSQSNPGHIMRSIRRFLGKADLTLRDVQILRGIMSQMDWYISDGKHLEADRVKKP